MQSKASTVAEYIASLPPDRQAAISTIREVILKNLKGGYEEGMNYGMIGYYVPHSIYPDGYHCTPELPLPFAGLASQKNHISVYLMCVYGSEEHEGWFRKAWEATGKKLNMGKSCIRFKKLEDAALDVIGEAIARVPVPEYIAYYERAIKSNDARKAKRAAEKKTAAGGGKAGSKKKVKKVAAKKKLKAAKAPSRKVPAKTAGKASKQKKKK